MWYEVLRGMCVVGQDLVMDQFLSPTGCLKILSHTRLRGRAKPSLPVPVGMSMWAETVHHSYLPPDDCSLEITALKKMAPTSAEWNNPGSLFN